MNWQRGMDEGDGWNAVFWNNHDQPRANSRFGDVENYPIETATMLAQTIHLLRGTPYIYQGEEIGMTNPNYDQIEDYVDIETHNAYKELKDKGLAENEIMEIIQEKSRDNSRTPMQWNTDENAGFSSGEPWLNVPKNYTELNTENELISKKIRDYYKELIQLRKEYLIIQEGSYEPFELGHQSVFGYIREYEQQKLLVLNHFYADEAIVKIPKALLDWKQVI